MQERQEELELWLGGMLTSRCAHLQSRLCSKPHALGRPFRSAPFAGSCLRCCRLIVASRAMLTRLLLLSPGGRVVVPRIGDLRPDAPAESRATRAERRFYEFLVGPFQ
jgi:hypothetical protein